MPSTKITALLCVLLLSVSVLSVSAHAVKVVEISTLSADASGDSVSVSVGVKAAPSVRDARLTVSIPEIGVRASRSVDVGREGKRTVMVELRSDVDIVPGDAYVKVVVKGARSRTVRYYPIQH